MSGTAEAISALPALSQARDRAVPRTLFVDHAAQLGGAELILLDIVRAFAGRAAVRMFEDGPLRERLRERGVPVILPADGSAFAGIKRDRSLLRAAPLAAGLLRTALSIARDARAFDLIYANSQKAFVLSAIASVLSRRPLVWHLHDILDRAHFGGPQLHLVVALANRVAAAVLVPSRAVARSFLAAGGRPDLPHLVPNGVTLDQDPVPAAARPALRRALGLPAGFLVGVFSRLAPWKGQDVALRALADLPGAGCVITGDALFGEHAYAAELRRLAASLGVADRVRFLGHRADVPRLMQAVDAVVHPSVAAEPFGRTLVEGMLSRVPVVAAAAGAVPEILDEGRAGVLVPPGDAAALAAALRALRQAPAGFAGMIELAHDRARKAYSSSLMQERVREVVCQVCAA